MQAFLLSMSMIFLAELGDKTQLVALTMATRYNTRLVLWGIFGATFTVHIVSTAIGWLMGGLLPTDWINLLAGLAFIGFGFWTLRGDCLDGDEECKYKVKSPFGLIFVTFFLAELGDKTMLSTVTLATNHSFIPVWFGSTIGMVFSDGLAIIVGKILGARLPEKAITIGAAVIFFGFGAVSMVQGLWHLPSFCWAIGIIGTAILGLIFLKPVPTKSSQATDKKAS